jgi:two-component system LytT family sensor kinase
VIKFSSKYTVILVHIVVWSMLFGLPHLFISRDHRAVNPGFFPTSFFTITNIYHVCIFYLNAFVLYPLLFNKRRWWAYILVVAGIVIGSLYLKLLVARQWYPQVIIDRYTYLFLFFPTLAFIVISTIYKLIVDKIKHEKMQKESAAEQLAIKLKFLRSQINPHFIFNVLTNLVSLARKRSEQMEPALIMLSDLMRYMLYESDENRVTLLTEAGYLKSYVELQKLRFGDDVLIKVNIDLPQNQLQYSIEPMLLIPFVENAFKHGMDVDEPLITIQLSVNNGRLEFDVKNKFSSNANEGKDASAGIGLDNVQSRLMLLYPKQHTLTITKENNLFHVYLTLQLK